MSIGPRGRDDHAGRLDFGAVRLGVTTDPVITDNTPKQVRCTHAYTNERKSPENRNRQLSRSHSLLKSERVSFKKEHVLITRQKKKELVTMNRYSLFSSPYVTAQQ